MIDAMPLATPFPRLFAADFRQLAIYSPPLMLH